MRYFKTFNGLVHDSHKCAWCKIEYDLYQKLKWFGLKGTKEQGIQKSILAKRGKTTLTPKRIEWRRRLLFAST